ncbi:S1 family peptidase [Austwickia chelonae]|uniref:S1 family peptidase n=1 Tax=Austwickia chelonae TaxID=100225 RepID=UPI0013C373CF|nr:serine protease [Austwickia chelonae]
MSKSSRKGRLLSVAAATMLVGGLLTPCTTHASPPADPTPSPRIIGGVQAEENEFPFMVSIQAGERHFCGGSLIDANTVLTAAHCVSERVGSTAQGVNLVIGRTTLSDSSQGITRKIKVVNGQADITIHPRYAVIAGYDAALLRLNEPVHGITPVALPPRGATGLTTSGRATVIGWGTVDPSGERDMPDGLRKVTIPLHSTAACAEDGGHEYNAATDLCGGSAGKGACFSDSGGPLVRRHAGRLYQIGIVSWGKACGHAEHHSFFTSTASSTLWNTFRS